MSPWFLRRIVQCSLATAPLHLCSLVRGKYRLITRERERRDVSVSFAKGLQTDFACESLFTRYHRRFCDYFARRFPIKIAREKRRWQHKNGKSAACCSSVSTTVTRWHCSLRVPANARKNSERRSITSTQETYDSRRRRFLCASTKRNMYVCSTNTSRVLLARSNSIGSRICLAGRDRLSVR